MGHEESPRAFEVAHGGSDLWGAAQNYFWIQTDPILNVSRMMGWASSLWTRGFWA